MFAGEVTRTGVVGNARSVLTAARQAGVPVFYTRVVYQPGYPGLIVNGPLFEGIRPTGAFIAGGKGRGDPAGTGPQEGDTVLDNGRVSAFTDTGLHDTLRKRGIQTIVLTGVSTHITVSVERARGQRPGLPRSHRVRCDLGGQRRIARTRPSALLPSLRDHHLVRDVQALMG